MNICLIKIIGTIQKQKEDGSLDLFAITDVNFDEPTTSNSEENPTDKRPIIDILAEGLKTIPEQTEPSSKVSTIDPQENQLHNLGNIDDNGKKIEINLTDNELNNLNR